jgi:hypothetical protein
LQARDWRKLRRCGFSAHFPSQSVAPDGQPDLELALEPNANPAAKKFQEAMFAQGIPLAASRATLPASARD